jgi:glycosyltransferase involved in cell wall biosynthesis
MRIDFHVHSRHSKRPSQWILQKIGCPESFTEPTQLYRIAKARGMDRVTITDHNTIDGALEIVHLPDTFISEEITTYFPEDKCKLHVLALNISEKQHADIQKVRADVFELVAWLREQNILHVLAHPLFAINDRLTVEHFEVMLLLFDNLELNGARSPRENEVLKRVVESLSQTDILRLSEKHHIDPVGKRPWEKRLFAGSDDHSSLNIARAYTELRAPYEDILTAEGIASVELLPQIKPSSPKTMAHNFYGIAYQFYRDRLSLERFADRDVMIRFLDRSLGSESENSRGLLSRLIYGWNRRKRRLHKMPVTGSLVDLLKAETRKLLDTDIDLQLDVEPGGGPINGQDQRWFDFVKKVSDRVILHFGRHMVDSLSGANVFNVFQTLGSAGGLYALLAPYFVAFSLFSRDREFSRRLLGCFLDPANDSRKSADTPCVAHFTDTFHEVNGVARTLQQHVRMAGQYGKSLTVVTCCNDGVPTPGVKNFTPVGVYELPEYPEQKLACPSLLGMLQFCYEQGFTQIHTATPGPVGLAALAIARILKLPISGTYHTEIPQYAGILTGDEAIADMTWKYTLWYYGQMDVIYTPSESTKRQLTGKGIDAAKVRVYPRGVDTRLFHPAKRNGYFGGRHNVHGGLKFLYVGRVSREKNLHILAEAFRRLVSEIGNVHLVVVGDGPYLAEMKRELQGCPCIFTGYLDVDILPTVYASSDIFVFPSTTDTFGNVVLEAQASGLPVIVTDQGGPMENVVSERTGLVVRGGEPRALLRAMGAMARQPDRVREMGQAARRYMENRTFDSAFKRTWRLYAAVETGQADSTAPLTSEIQ